MPNNLPVGNLDFVSPVEALNAQIRDPQLGRIVISPSVLSVNFSASTLFGVTLQGTATLSITDVTASYVFGANTVAVFAPGLPFGYPPPGGAVTAALSTTGTHAVLLYK